MNISNDIFELCRETNNQDNDPLVAPKPFGNTSLVGEHSTFGGPSNGVFGRQPSSQAFGISSSPACGASSRPAFDASSSPSGASGQSSNSPFGSPTVLVDTNDKFPKPSGNTSPFGVQTQSSIFGGTSPGVFGPQPSSPAFGIPSTSAFGVSSTPAFGASSSPVFGASSSPFGGSSRSEQKPGFGGLYVKPSSHFGSSFQQSQPASRSTPFGFTPFGASSQPAFGSTSFGGSSQPAFGSTATPAFGVPKSSLFRSSNPAAFASSVTPAFSTTSSPFSFGPSSSSFEASQATTPAFGSPDFGQTSCGFQLTGSRVTPYAKTPELGFSSAKLQSISAMPSYKEKNHEELRWEDYQATDEGQSNSTSPSLDRNGYFTYSSAFYGRPMNPFASKTSIFDTLPEVGSSANNTQQQQSNGFSFSPAFGQQKADTLNATCSFIRSTPSLSQPYPVGSTPAFSFPTSPSPSGTSNVSSSSYSISLNFGSTQSSPLFHSTTPSLLQVTINNMTTPSTSVPFQSTQPPWHPFGTLPDTSQVSVDRNGTSVSIQYGAEQPTVVKISVPTNKSPCLNLEIEKLMNLRI